MYYKSKGLLVMNFACQYPDVIHKTIDKKLIKQRLKDYPATGKTFPFDTLQPYFDKPPFYCHYMAWRLGLEGYEDFLSNFEELLGCARSVCGWKNEKSLLTTAEWGDFWSLVWQLQVAHWLCRVGKSVKWSEGSGGPDLSAELDGKRWHVECYVYRRSFVLLRFIEEFLHLIDPHLRVAYGQCLPFSLPQGRQRQGFLNTILGPLLASGCLAEAREQAEKEWPVILYQGPGDNPDNPLVILLEGDRNYQPGRKPKRVGSPTAYVETALNEAINAKKDSNRLSEPEHRPNMLAANFVLSKDFQLAKGSERAKLSPPQVDLPPQIDVLGFSTVGIDDMLNGPWNNSAEKVICLK